MSFRKSIITAALAILGFTASPSPASADWLFTPFIGTTFNAAANFNDAFEGGDEFERQFTYGASVGWMGAGIVGFEFDFGYSPNFFETAVTDDDDFEFVDDSNVTTLMANVIVGAPIGGQSGFGIRPFGVAGVGLIRTRLEDADDFFDEVDTNDFGFNVGAGLNIFFADNIGVRGDIRYFRAFGDDEDEDAFDFRLTEFDFWRATVGVTFRWGY
jgi:opacity protein-like surface antigen